MKMTPDNKTPEIEKRRPLVEVLRERLAVNDQSDPEAILCDEVIDYITKRPLAAHWKRLFWAMLACVGATMMMVAILATFTGKYKLGFTSDALFLSSLLVLGTLATFPHLFSFENYPEPENPEILSAMKSDIAKQQMRILLDFRDEFFNSLSEYFFQSYRGKLGRILPEAFGQRNSLNLLLPIHGNRALIPGYSGTQHGRFFVTDVSQAAVFDWNELRDMPIKKRPAFLYNIDDEQLFEKIKQATLMCNDSTRFDLEILSCCRQLRIELKASNQQMRMKEQNAKIARQFACKDRYVQRVRIGDTSLAENIVFPDS